MRCVFVRDLLEPGTPHFRQIPCTRRTFEFDQSIEFQHFLSKYEKNRFSRFTDDFLVPRLIDKRFFFNYFLTLGCIFHSDVFVKKYFQPSSQEAHETLRINLFSSEAPFTLHVRAQHLTFFIHINEAKNFKYMEYIISIKILPHFSYNLMFLQLAFS